MRKITKKQIRHDKAVLKSALWYKNHGFKVQADLPDWKKPKTIKGFIPDLIAKRSKKETILEVETRDTLKRDKKQHEAFIKYTKMKPTRKFRKKII